MQRKRDIFVTNALPFANGDIHLGHLLGYAQADIWVRFQRMLGNNVYYICADDTHGTPIMLKADSLGITPEELIAKAHAAHLQDFDNFHIDFDNYYTTHSKENQQLVEEIYLTLKANDLIETKTIEQFYDEERQMFLPDRFIKGECPKCHAKDQYGDNCEACGATYRPTELINPFSVVTGKTPVMRPSEHFFFKLSDPRCVEFLRQFLEDKERLQPEAANKMREWIGEEGDCKLSDWDISRDAPYFGFPIPNAENKYFYVWLDAPIGYFASFKNYCDRVGNIDFESFIKRDKAEAAGTEMVHFIGKDIMYFHTLFWPAMLNFSGHRVPSQYAINGFLTVDGAKMSKSRGTFITADSYIAQKLDPEWLRYYFAAKSNGAIDDFDLNLDDFVNRVNADLIGKYVNIASRTSRFISKNFDNRLGEIAAESVALIDSVIARAPAIQEGFEKRNFAAALREISAACDDVNEHFDQMKPWEIAKDESRAKLLQDLCTGYLEAFRILTLYLKPVLPVVAERVEKFLNIAPLTFAALQERLPQGHLINDYEHLMTRLNRKDLDAMIEANREALSVVRKDAQQADKAGDKVAKSEQKKGGKGPDKDVDKSEEEAYISIDDFAKIDLRLGKVLSCDFIEGADKLLTFQIDLGEERPRTIFSGIRKFYQDPAALVGMYVVVVANLAPRKMRFGVSEGMILSASTKEELTLLTSLSELKPGAKIS
ncbi:methionine--tRNA ligase [Ignatzschineria sp. F8392]|uniref:methionine--tRNA ligase n=1 Tax=Ignatzschineria sp. F8392 TaxID=1980117 RepID=UPI000B98D806|nr:methionine--tRNA ligase [Ignatzschineria sp. F8392]OYQ81155.1 methionine--tRNA ligase [Ignatzschineria sp. F8392]